MDYAGFSVPNVANGQTIATSTTSAQSAALKQGNYTCVVSVITFVLRGANPTATNACAPLAPNTVHVLQGIQDGERLAFLAVSGTGTASICPAP